MDHLFFDHLKSVFFNSTMLTFYNNVRWNFLHIRLMLQMMPPPLSFFFFSSSRLSPTATAGFRDEWWVDSLFLLLWLPRRDFCSLFLLLWLSLGIYAGLPAKRDLLKKILEDWNLKLQDLNPQSSSLFTIENFSPVPGIEPGSALPIMSLLHLLQSSIDADMK